MAIGERDTRIKYRRINAATASLIGAALAFLGVVATSALAQWGAAKLEDRRARTELVLELMRTNNREETLQKLHILNASGLLPDEDGRLIRAVTEAPELAFRIQEVMIPIPVRCADPADIPAELPPRGRLSDNASEAVAAVGARALELKAQNELMRLDCLHRRFAER